jgi:hypothetical protein
MDSSFVSLGNVLFAVAVSAATNYHKLRGFTQHKSDVLQFWKQKSHKAKNQGVSKDVFPFETRWETGALLF